MRIGYALDTHATATTGPEVPWSRWRGQAQLAELVGFDVVVAADDLLYAAEGPGDHAQPDAAVGAHAL